LLAKSTRTTTTRANFSIASKKLWMNIALA
jgi:hypothetical protein